MKGWRKEHPTTTLQKRLLRDAKAKSLTWYKCSLNTRCVPITWDQILSYTTRDDRLTWYVYDMCLAHSCYTWKIVGVWIGLLLCASKSAWSQRPRCVDVLPQWSIVHLIIFCSSTLYSPCLVCYARSLGVVCVVSSAVCERPSCWVGNMKSLF